MEIKKSGERKLRNWKSTIFSFSHFLIFLLLAGCWDEKVENLGSLGYPITALAIDPSSCACTADTSATDTTPVTGACENLKNNPNLQLVSCKTVYAATDGGGLFKTEDGGATWHISLVPSEMYIKALAVDAHPKATTPRVVYAGTENAGVMRSENGGVSWIPQTDPLILSVSAVIVDPKTDDLDSRASCRVLGDGTPPCYTIFAASQGSGVWRSDNQGQSWQPITGESGFGLTEPSVTSLALSPPKNTPTLLYAGTEGGRVFKYTPDSVDPTNPAKGRWTEQTSTPVLPSNTPLLPRDAVSLAVHPGGRPLYAGLGGLQGGGGGGLWRSDDDGLSWNEVAPNLNTNPDSVYVLSFVKLPEVILYAGFSGLKKCIDSSNCLLSANWADLKVPSNKGVSALAVDPYTQTFMIAGNYIGQLFRSLDRGTTWTKLNVGF